MREFKFGDRVLLGGGRGGKVIRVYHPEKSPALFIVRFDQPDGNGEKVGVFYAEELERVVDILETEIERGK